jgi:hypothetical protein
MRSTTPACPAIDPALSAVRGEGPWLPAAVRVSVDGSASRAPSVSFWEPDQVFPIELHPFDTCESDAPCHVRVRLSVEPERGVLTKVDVNGSESTINPNDAGPSAVASIALAAVLRDVPAGGTVVLDGVEPNDSSAGSLSAAIGVGAAVAAVLAVVIALGFVLMRRRRRRVS